MIELWHYYSNVCIQTSLLFWKNDSSRAFYKRYLHT